jgi:hypothetical protein
MLKLYDPKQQREREREREERREKRREKTEREKREYSSNRLLP